MPIHTASAEWRGKLRDGEGTLSSGSGLLAELPYTFASRFEVRKQQTNPEELIGAAHAGCFTMALVAALDREGQAPERIRTEAQVALAAPTANTPPGIEYIELHTEAVVPGMDPARFKALADDAKANCVVSRALRVEIRLTANLVGGPGVGGNR